MDFKALIEEIDEQEVKVPFGELERGVLYKILALKKTSSQYNGKEISGMHAQLLTEEGMKLFTYLPKKYISMKEALMNEINAKGHSPAPYTIAFYGTIGTTNIAKIHLPKEGKKKIVTNNAILKMFLCFTYLLLQELIKNF